MARFALVLSFVLLVAAGAASAATPAAYKATVNGICRSYTPQLKAAAAKQGGIQEVLQLRVAQNRKIAVVAVPAALRAQMTPILAKLKLVSVQSAKGIKAFDNGDEETLTNATNAIATLLKSLAPQLTAAGLRDCVQR